MKKKTYSFIALAFFLLGFIAYTYIAFYSTFYRKFHVRSGGGVDFIRTPLISDCIPIIIAYAFVVLSLLVLIVSLISKKKLFLFSAPIFLFISIVIIAIVNTELTEIAEFAFLRYNFNYNSTGDNFDLIKYIFFFLAFVFEIASIINNRTIKSFLPNYKIAENG